MEAHPTIGIIGGTGELGAGLAKRWAKAKHAVLIGSRSREKAEILAGELAALYGANVSGGHNLSVAEAADLIVIAVPWANHDDIIEEIKSAVSGKIVVDAVVPLVPPKVSTVQLPEPGSAAARARTILGESVRVVAAFHNVSARKLHMDDEIECDILVCGDDKNAREQIIGLTEAAGMRGIDAGVLANSAACEALTSVLIGINRRYKVAGAGIRITGIPKAPNGSIKNPL